jgi:bifunctional ADP-heptose synthase (sugar kinase/adenylyltransferase)
MGGLLVVGVTRDIDVNKGPGRPVIKQADRLEMIRGLACVFEAYLFKDSMQALKHWKPAVYVKGIDYATKGLLPEEISYCADNGIEIRFTNSPKESTTQLIERIRS